MSLPGADPTPAEALEWALEATPGAAEEFARAEVSRLRAIEAKYAECVGLIERLGGGHWDYCPAGYTPSARCLCDFDAREALRKLAES